MHAEASAIRISLPRPSPTQPPLPPPHTPHRSLGLRWQAPAQMRMDHVMCRCPPSRLQRGVLRQQGAAGDEMQVEFSSFQYLHTHYTWQPVAYDSSPNGAPVAERCW